MTSTWSPSSNCLCHSSDTFFTTLRLPVTQFCSNIRHHLYHSVTWIQKSPSQFRQFCWPHLISQWQMTLHNSTTFFITLCLPLKKVSVKAPTLFHHTWFQLTNYFDTVATLSSPRLSTSDEWLHHCSDNFFTPLVLLVTNFPITVPTIFPPTSGMLVANIYITNQVL